MKKNALKDRINYERAWHDDGPLVRGRYEFGQIVEVTVVQHRAFGMFCTTANGDRALARIFLINDGASDVELWPNVGTKTKAVVLSIKGSTFIVSTRKSFLDAASTESFESFVIEFYENL